MKFASCAVGAGYVYGTEGDSFIGGHSQVITYVALTATGILTC